MNRGSDLARAAIAAAPALLAVGVLVGTLVASTGGCGPPPPVRIDPARNRLPLDAWISVLPDSQAAVRPCVQVSAPHRSLVFRRDDAEFHSGLEVRVIAWRDGDQVGGGVATARVSVPDADATRAETALAVMVPLLIRGDEPVTLEVTAQVLESSRAWLRELTFVPGALEAVPVWVADLQALPPAARGGDHVVDTTVDSLRIAATLYRRADATTWPAGRLSLVTEATGAALGELALQRERVPGDLAAGQKRTVEVVWPTETLPFGRCRLQGLVELVRGDEWVRLPHEPPLEIVNLRVNLTADEAWRRQLDWLDGILTGSRRDSLRDIARADRPDAWAEIWRDVGTAAGTGPTTAERQHLSRIVAADDRFGAYGRGARSDRGRTLIRWGEPAHIESYGDSRAAGAVWEVWDYPERDLRLFFYDAHGTGDFRLRRQEPLAR